MLLLSPLNWTKSPTRKIFPILLGCYAFLGFSNVAYGETEQVASQKQIVISNGTPIQLDSLGLEVTPINGWEVNTGGAISVVMQEPAAIEDPKSEEPTFRRNITIATIHEALPVDAKRGAALKQELTDKFGQSLSNFGISDVQFFDYKNSKDGIILYTDFTHKKFEMRQMHVLVGGSANQFLLTYTDFRKNFGTKSANEAEAWKVMSTIQIEGEAPVRYQSLYSYGPIALAALALIMILMLLRSLKNKALLRKVIADVDNVEGDFKEYQEKSAWNLAPNSRRGSTQPDATDYSAFNGTAPETSTYHGFSTF